MAEVSRLRSQHLWSQQSTRDTDSRSPFCPGDKVDGRYLIDGYIARGGMSVVYRAIDTRLDRPVALKVLRSDLSCLLYTSPSPRDLSTSRMPSSA